MANGQLGILEQLAALIRREPGAQAPPQRDIDEFLKFRTQDRLSDPSLKFVPQGSLPDAAPISLSDIVTQRSAPSAAVPTPATPTPGATPLTPTSELGRGVTTIQDIVNRGSALTEEQRIAQQEELKRQGLI